MSWPKKLNLKLNDRVRIKNTGTELDGIEVIVTGIMNRNILDTYILSFNNNDHKVMPDFGPYTSFCMWEANMEKI